MPPTEDTFVEFPLHVGMNVKRDEYAAQPGTLRLLENADFAGQIGRVFREPRHFRSTFNSRADAMAVVAGHPTTFGRDGIVRTPNNFTTFPNGTDRALSLDLRGRAILGSRHPVTKLVSCTAPPLQSYYHEQALYAWRDEASSGDIHVAIRRGDGTRENSFVVQADAGSDFCAVRQNSRLFLYYVASGFIYAAQDGDSPQLLDTIAGITTEPMDAVFADNGSNLHYLMVGQNIYSVNPTFGSNALLWTAAASPSGNVSIDWDPDIDAIWAAFYTDLTSITVIGVSLSGGGSHEATLAYGIDPSGGQPVSIRAGIDAVGGLVPNRAFVLSAKNPGAFSILSNGDAVGWLVGDGVRDEAGNIIFPLAKLDSAGSPLRWPSDPKIVGYQLVNDSPYFARVMEMHPVAVWAVDRARSVFSRSHESFPYVGDPRYGSSYTGQSIYDVQLHHRRGAPKAHLGVNGDFVGLGLPAVVDSRYVVPAGHLWRPEKPTGSFSGSSGLTPAGTYKYKIVFFWETSGGTVVRSADSPEQEEVAGAADQTLTLEVDAHLPPVHADGNASNAVLRAHLYGTIAGGQDFYRIHRPLSGPAGLGSRAGEPVEGEWVGDGFVFELDFAYPCTDDGSATGNPITAPLTFTASPPELAPETPTTPADVAATSNRVWLLDAEDRTVLWYSKVLGLDRLSPEFNALLRLRIPGQGGDVVGLETISGYIVAFKRESIWVVMDQEGPSNILGQGGVFPRPTQVADVGCVNWRSMVAFPEGVLFSTGQRLMVLGRGLGVAPAGEQVQPLIQDATLYMHHVGRFNEIHVTVVPDGADEDVAAWSYLVWNYDLDQWHQRGPLRALDEDYAAHSQYFLSIEAGEEGGSSIWQLPLVGGDFPQLSVSSAPRDPQVIRTHYVRPGEPRRARRVREVLVEWFVDWDDPSLDFNNSDIVITLESSFEPAQVATWTPAELLALGPQPGERMVLRVLPQRQMDAVRVTIEWSDGGNRRFAPVHLAVAFGAEPGVERLYPEGSTK